MSIFFHEHDYKIYKSRLFMHLSRRHEWEGLETQFDNLFTESEMQRS